MFGQKRLSREGGVEIVVKELCTRMAQNGCDVTCYNRAGHHVSGAEYDDAGKTEYEGIRQKSVLTIERRGLAAVSSSAFAAALIVHLENTMVHIHAEGPAFFALAAEDVWERVVCYRHMALIGSARNGNQDLVLSLSTWGNSLAPVPCKHRVLRAPWNSSTNRGQPHAAIAPQKRLVTGAKGHYAAAWNHQAGNYTKRQYPLKGKVYCGYCQKLMKYRVLKKLGPSFNCRFSATAVDSPCKRIPISEELLEHIIRNALTAQIKQAEYVLEILHERERKALVCFSALERQEEKLSAEKAEIVKQRVALYEQYADGNMSKEEFIRQRDSYRAQEDERMEQIQRLRTEKDQAFQPVKKDTDNLQAVMDTVGGAGDVMHLSQNVVETFIDRIEVFNDESVKIRFTFEDVLKNYEAE